jgi:hypothetical protein
LFRNDLQFLDVEVVKNGRSRYGGTVTLDFDPEDAGVDRTTGKPLETPKLTVDIGFDPARAEDLRAVVPARYVDGPTPTERPGVGPPTGPAGSHRTSGGAPDPNAPAQHADASTSARGGATPSRPPQVGEDSTPSRPPNVEDPTNERRPTGPRNDQDKGIGQQHVEGGTTDGAGRVVQLRDPARYAKFIQDASPLHKAIDEHQRYEVIRDFPVREVYSAPGHQNLREPGKMLGMAEKMDKLNTGNIFDGAEPIKLNIFTEQVSGHVVVKSIEVTDGRELRAQLPNFTGDPLVQAGVGRRTDCDSHWAGFSRAGRRGRPHRVTGTRWSAGNRSPSAGAGVGSTAGPAGRRRRGTGTRPTSRRTVRSARSGRR